MLDLGWTLSFACYAMYSEVWWSKLQEAGGDSPRTLWGASSVWPQFRFFPFRAALGAGGGGGARFQAGARVLDRTGPDKGRYSKA